MKTILAVLAFAFIMPFADAREEYGETRDQVVAINDAYIPSNFDSSSDAFVVINGIFPNSCYRFKEAKLEHVGELVHEVKAHAVVTEGLCLMVLVPFSKEVQLGKLAAGKHKIKFINGDGTFWEKSFVVEN